MRIFALSFFFAPLMAQPPVFQAGVSQVRVDVEVFSSGHPVSKLLAQHFLVKDNGEPQRVVHVSQSQEPLDVILLFDVSGSMKPTVERVAASAKKAMKHLRQGDRVAVMTFAGQPRLLGGFTDDLRAAERTIEQDVLDQEFEGGTRIWDAVHESAQVHHRQGRSGRRRAVVIITDNYGQKGKVEENATLESLWEADAILCGVIIPNPKEAKRTPRPVKVNRLTEETGGDTILSEDPGEAFEQMIERIRSRYSVYYEMPKGTPGEFRTVRVELRGMAKELYPEARLYARKGYKLPD